MRCNDLYTENSIEEFNEFKPGSIIKLVGCPHNSNDPRIGSLIVKIMKGAGNKDVIAIRISDGCGWTKTGINLFEFELIWKA